MTLGITLDVPYITQFNNHESIDIPTSVMTHAGIPFDGLDPCTLPFFPTFTLYEVGYCYLISNIDYCLPQVDPL